MSYFRLFLMTIALGVGCANAATSDAPKAQAPAGFWDHWGDGQAELAGYRLHQPRYGEMRTGEAVLIFVTETFTHAQRLKSDGGHSDEYPVIKLNEVRDFPTGVYDYNVMTSTFLRLDGADPIGRPVKVSFSMQEWCGQVWDQWRIDENKWRRTGHGYFDGEGDAQTQGVFEGHTVFADALPLVVRGLTGDLLAPGASASFLMVPRSMTERLTHTRSDPFPVTITRSAEHTLATVPAGRFEVETWTVQKSGQLLLTYLVEKAAPHRLIQWMGSNGERGELTGAVRMPYWQRAREGDEKLREQLGFSSPAP